MKFVIKAINRLIGIMTLLKYKVMYGKRFSFSFTDRVTGSLKIRMSGNAKLVLGKNVNIREYVIFNLTDGEINIADDVFLNDFVCLNSRETIQIGEGTVIGQGVKFYDHDHDYKGDMQHSFIVSPIEIKDNVWIGSNAVILRGSKIESHSVIGAETLLKGTVTDNSVCFNERRLVQKNIER